MNKIQIKKGNNMIFEARGIDVNPTTEIQMLPFCTRCKTTLEKLKLTYKINDTFYQTEFDPKYCPNCGAEIERINYPYIPFYEQSHDGQEIIIR